MNRKTFLQAGIAAIVLATGLTACGNSETSTAAKTKNAALTTPPTVSGTTIVSTAPTTPSECVRSDAAGLLTTCTAILSVAGNWLDAAGNTLGKIPSLYFQPQDGIKKINFLNFGPPPGAATFSGRVTLVDRKLRSFNVPLKPVTP